MQGVQLSYLSSSTPSNDYFTRRRPDAGLQHHPCNDGLLQLSAPTSTIQKLQRVQSDPRRAVTGQSIAVCSDRSTGCLLRSKDYWASNCSVDSEDPLHISACVHKLYVLLSNHTSGSTFHNITVVTTTTASHTYLDRLWQSRVQRCGTYCACVRACNRLPTDSINCSPSAVFGKRLNVAVSRRLS